MSKGIIPLRPRGEKQSALARVDLVASELLAGGQATNLQGARIEVILMDMRVQRDRMATLLADLRGREPIRYSQVDAANADLLTAINIGIAQIDLFIARAMAFVEEANIPGRPNLTHRDGWHKASNAYSARPASSGSAPVP